MRAKLMVFVLLLVAGAASAQEVRKALPVEQPVRKAIPLEPEQGQEFHFNFVPNTYMPADTVELSPEHVVQPGEFYAKPPAKRPVIVGPTFVLVKVYQLQVYYQGQEPDVVFVGWQWMDADAVNALHGLGAVLVSL